MSEAQAAAHERRTRTRNEAAAPSVHEVALAEAVWRQVTAEMARHEGHRLLAIRLVVGGFSGADPESLQFAIELMRTDSAWPEAAIEMRSEPLALVCRRCRREFEAPDLNLICPGCGGADVEAVRGTDLRLESLEID